MITSIIVVTIINLLMFYIPYKNRAFLLKYWSKSLIAVYKFLCQVKINIHGLENIPDTPCLIFSKHQSTLETLILQTIFVPHVWIIKRELTWVPFFGWSVLLSKPIAINRSDAKGSLRKIMELGTERLKDGFWVFIFPEGTRNPVGERAKHKIGGAKLAHRSGFDILPIALNTGIVWPRGQFTKLPGTVDIVIGEVMTSKDKSVKEILRETEDWIETESLKLVNK